MAATVIFLTAPTGSNQTWNVPADWNSSSNTIEVIGAGAGGSLNSSNFGAAGGGGGYSAISNLTLTPSGTATFRVGTGGAAETAGGATWFNGTTAAGASVAVNGGGAPSGGGVTGGIGGTVVVGAGATGGAGGNVAGASEQGGAGGGGAAGPNGAGKAGGAVPNPANPGSGGGGANNGAVGGDSDNTNAGVGGNNRSGSGGGAAGTAGTNGGGGGGGVNPGGNAGAGSQDTLWTQTSDSALAGPGSGGGGGGGNSGGAAGAGGGYGGGGGGGGYDSGTPGVGKQGIIVITYTALTSIIQFDAASNSGDQAASANYTFNRTVAGSNRFLLVNVELLTVTGATVTSVTDDDGAGNVALTFIGAKTTVTGAGRVEMWGLAAPATGTKAIRVILSASIESVATAISYTGVHQTTATESFNSAQATNAGSATNASVTITSVTDKCWVAAACVANDTSIAAGQTSRNNVSGTLGSGADEDNNAEVTPAGATTMTYTGMGITTTWAIAGVALRPYNAATDSQEWLMPRASEKSRQATHVSY